MKKLLVFAVLLLSGCVSDITVYKHYDIAAPETKARLHVTGSYRDTDAPQKIWLKYFIKSDERNADFVLNVDIRIDTDNNIVGWTFLNVFSLWIIPTWGTYKNAYSFTLTQRETGRTVQLSDITEKVRAYSGWLMLPMAFSSETQSAFNTDSPGASTILGNAIEEAASIVYNKNSLFYKQPVQKKWAAPVNTVPAATKDETPTVTTTAPVKEQSPEEMDMLW